VNDEIDTLPPRTSYIKTSPEFTRIKKIVAGMHPYTAKQVSSGVWKGQGGNAVPPAAAPMARLSESQWVPQGNWQTLEGDGFTIQYPGNWKAAVSAPGALIAPPGGVGAQDSVGYGMLGGRFQPPQLGETAAETDQLVAQLRQQNPELKPGAAADVVVNGVRGRSLEATNSGAAGGGTERDWLVALPEPMGSLRYVVFVAPDADFNALRPTFERMLGTLKLTR
jgi:hypothetical protein